MRNQSVVSLLALVALVTCAPRAPAAPALSHRDYLHAWTGPRGN